MKALLYVGCAVLALSARSAVAQTASETTTTQSTTQSPTLAPTLAPNPVPPPPGTLSTTHTVRAVDAYGNQYDQRQTTYRNPNGVAEDSRTVTRTMAPPPPAVTTTTTTTNSTTSGPQ